MYATMKVCSSNTCKNGGTCHEITPRTVGCDCVEGFVGSTCEGNAMIDIVQTE